MSVHTETLTYPVGDEQMRGFLAYDQAVDGPRPGVMVIHEWWGLDGYIERRARMLAELGYTALALDMYGSGQTGSSPDEAGALMNGVLGDMETGTRRLEAGRSTLAGHPLVDATRMAAIGYCFGGAMVLHCARIGMDLAAVASFHGALGSFHKPGPGEVKAKVLVCHGAADVLVPETDIEGFKAEMDEAGADYEFMSLEGALHGFSNPAADGNGQRYGLPLAYDEKADARSWSAMQALFREAFA